MWRPATRQITGTNEGAFAVDLDLYCFFLIQIAPVVPLGSRRRFGPAPAEESAPPQLAQPSPSVYPRQPAHNDQESPKRGRDDSPVTLDAQGKPDVTIIDLTASSLLSFAIEILQQPCKVLYTLCA